MIAVDTNVLVYAHRPEVIHHERARDALQELVGSGRPWAIPWPCLHEFLAVVTHARIYRPPTSPSTAMHAIELLIETGGATLIGESGQHLAHLSALLTTARATGPRVHDARIAAICLGHGVDELWTADRDFSSFPALRTRNPLVG